ncbi:MULTISPECIES: hypothetical protein [Burkholderiaceae]|uniref:hypothetical protein n=1 Tax=Burkholderiaceae TaxID=119060 RepID=UPI0015895964|nr:MULTISPECIES: hypothetical protein [Burkholderiaceae]MBU7436119.1 hypothetical protein [Paraburkholderia fungorum]
MTITSLTIDQIEGEFPNTEAANPYDRETLLWNNKFYALVGELFPNTDPRVIHAVTQNTLESNEGDLKTSQVRRVIHAMENGFVNEPFFVSTFNAEYPVTEDDLGDRAEWENTALVVKRDGGEVRWGFEGSEL